MGKAANCIKMLQILNTGRIFKVSELADMLQTNPRNVIEYKEEINSLFDDVDGISRPIIIPVYGKNGGYQLNGNAVLPSLKLTDAEKKLFVSIVNYTLSKPDFLKKEAATNLFAKIMSSIEIEDKENKLVSVHKYSFNMEDHEIKKRYEFLDDAIKSHRTIEMSYLSIRSGRKIHTVDPYQLVNYNNAWFFIGWDHDAAEVWYFKLNRIEKYHKLDKKFVVWKFFKAEDYFDDEGLLKQGETFHIELEATGLHAMLLKERRYGKNQTIIYDGPDKTVVTLDMQNKSMIVAFVLGCGSEVKVIKPDWLQREIIKESEKIVSRYKEK